MDNEKYEFLTYTLVLEWTVNGVAKTPVTIQMFHCTNTPLLSKYWAYSQERRSQMKKLISILVVLSLMLSCSGYAFAAGETISENSFSSAKEQFLLNTVSDIVPQLTNTKLSSTSKVYLGAALSAYKIEDATISKVEYEIYPVLIDNEIVAIAQLSQNNAGEYTVCFVTSLAEGLQRYYQNRPKEAFSLVIAYEGVFLVDSGNDITCTYSAISEGLTSIRSVKNDWSNLKHTAIEANNSIPVEQIDLSVQDNEIEGTRSLQFMTLSVPYVANDTSTCSNADCNGRGLCWAASIAMIINYYRDTSYSAKSVHDATGCYSTGVPANYKSAIRTFGAYAYGAYYTFNYSTIQTIVQGYHPAYMRIERTDSDGNEYGHAIVPYGYYYNPDSASEKYFYYMDPNYGGGIASFPASGDPQITTSGNTYTFDYYIGTSW